MTTVNGRIRFSLTVQKNSLDLIEIFDKNKQQK